MNGDYQTSEIILRENAQEWTKMSESKKNPKRHKSKNSKKKYASTH